MNPRYRRPTFLLLLLWFATLGLCAAAAWSAMQQSWLELRLVAVDGKVQLARDTQGRIPQGAEVLRITGANGATLELRTSDLLDNTDTFPSYAHKDEFFARQDTLHAIQESGAVHLTWRAADGQEQTTALTPQARTLSSLSPMFWFTLAVASLCLLIACWVFLLRPRERNTQIFALTGITLFAGCITSALLSERSLALDALRLEILDTGNALAGILFGTTLVMLFLSYPRQLLSPGRQLGLVAFYLLWWLLDQLHLLPNPDLGVMSAILSQIVLMMTCGIVQWQRTANAPLERAALRWFVLSVLLGCSLFAFTNMMPRLFGQPELLIQGYAIGFFLIMYIGIALGLRRYRLFDMDEWAYRVLLWVGGATLVIALDALLIVAGLSLGVSFGISLLLGGWLYFPLRQWLWQRMVIRHTPSFESLLPELSAVAFAAGSGAQQGRWEELLQRIYEPLELHPAAADEVPGIGEDGLVMVVPGSGELPPLRLRHAGHGARLFSSRDAAFAASLSQALESMMGGRQSFEAGASQERQRIYRDLHDDMGAKLLGLAISAQRANLPKEADLARSALQDLRDVVSRDMHAPTPLADLLADWRMEAQQRVQAAGVSLDWRFPAQEPELLLTPEAALNLTRILREAISNVLRHAQAGRLRVTTGLDEQTFTLSVEDDGIGLPASPAPHRGMSSMQARAAALGAALDWQAVQPHGCRVTLSVPLAALTP
jgi:signal transduction histidine kinase